MALYVRIQIKFAAHKPKRHPNGCRLVVGRGGGLAIAREVVAPRIVRFFRSVRCGLLVRKERSDGIAIVRRMRNRITNDTALLQSPLPT